MASSRLQQLLATFSAVALLGWGIALLPSPQVPTPATTTTQRIVTSSDPAQHARDARQREIDLRFRQATAMLHARQYDYAVKALHRVLELSPKLVEAHVNMGYALIGLQQYRAAHDFFQGATALRPTQVNAYYGLATALEGMGDMEGALGAMRTYIHLSNPNDPYLAKARAALWEWQEGLQTSQGNGGAGKAAPQATAGTLPTGLSDASVIESVDKNH